MYEYYFLQLFTYNSMHALSRGYANEKMRTLIHCILRLNRWMLMKFASTPNSTRDTAPNLSVNHPAFPPYQRNTSSFSSRPMHHENNTATAEAVLHQALLPFPIPKESHGGLPTEYAQKQITLPSSFPITLIYPLQRAHYALVSTQSNMGEYDAILCRNFYHTCKKQGICCVYKFRQWF